MFTKLFNKINQSLIVENLLSAEINALKKPKQDHFTPEDLYIGIINFCQRKNYPLTRERLYTLTKYVNNTFGEQENYLTKPSSIHLLSPWQYHKTQSQAKHPTVWINVRDYSIIRYLIDEYFEKCDYDG